MFRRRHRYNRFNRFNRHRRPWRRNAQAPVWGGPLYRRNLIPLARRQELHELSPGNFRRPTIAITKDYLDEWEAEGVTRPEDMYLWRFEEEAANMGTTKYIERAKELNRFDEASTYMNQWKDANEEKLLLHAADPEKYGMPKMSSPKSLLGEGEDFEFRDYGDYREISRKQAYNYLYQFLHRNAEKRADGETIDDVRQAPFKWRYRDAVLTVGPEVATKLVHSTFGSFGKRAPKWYLPENLYDDLGELFPEVEAAGEAEEAAESARRRRRRMRRYNPW